MKRNNVKGKRILVTIKEWHETHPIGIVCKSDSYYARLASILASDVCAFIGDYDHVAVDRAKTIGIDLASYLEDLVSGFGLWNSFLSLYQDTRKPEDDYAKFPFYHTNMLFKDEPNIVEVAFLIWKALQGPVEKAFLSPLDPLVLKLTEVLLPVLEASYEEAPEAEELRDWLYDAERYEDPIEFRRTCEWLVLGCYLTHLEDGEKVFKTAEAPLARFYRNSLDDGRLGYSCLAYVTMNTLIGPLALPAWDYLARMMKLSEAPGSETLAERFAATESLTLSPYKILEKGDENFKVKSLGGEELTISYSNLMEGAKEDIKAGGAILSPLYFYAGEWQVNGTASFRYEYPEFEKDSADFRKANEGKKSFYDKCLASLGGVPIGVAADTEELTRKLGLDALPQVNGKKLPSDLKDILFFIDERGGLNMIPRGAKCVKLEGNTMYDAEFALKNSGPIFISDIVSSPLRDYIAKHDLMPEARLAGPQSDEDAIRWFADNIGFIASIRNSDQVLFREI